MEVSKFILEYLGGEIKRLGEMSLDCDYCPLREQCHADEEARFKAGLEEESCGEFLARMLTI